MLKRKMYFIVVLVFASLTIWSPGPITQTASSQEQAKIPIDQTYQRILDIIFPRDNSVFRKDLGIIEFTMVLRFTPAYDTESQVNIAYYNNGNVDVVMYRATKNVSAQLLDIEERTGGGQSLEVLAGLISTEKRAVKKPQRLIRRLLDQYAALRFSPKFDTDIHLDGTVYNLWYNAFSNKVHFSLAGPNAGAKRYNDPVIRWMNQVLQSVQ